MPDSTTTPTLPSAPSTGLFDSAVNAVSGAASWTTSSLASIASSIGGQITQMASDGLGKAMGAAGSSIQSFLTQMQDIKYCWSCTIYSSLFQNLHAIITTMYKTLVEQTPALLTLSAIILMIVLIFKLAKLLVSPFQQNHGGEWRQIYTYLLRIVVIYPVFLISASTAGVEDNGQFSPVTDLFISGPLALGSQLGATMAKVTCGIDQSNMSKFPACQTAANPTGTTGSSTSATTPGSGVGGGSTGSSSGATTPGSPSTAPTTPGSYSALEAQHLALAQSILFSFHRIGVAGIGAGVWAGTQLPSQSGMNIITRIAYIIAGFGLAMTYFMLTLTFGFRYIDALIRMFVVGSLIPIFLFLWIFDSTRRIAHAALRQMLFAGAAFAVAGLVVTIAGYIMVMGFNQAFPGKGAEALFDVNFWSSQQSGQWDWMMYFYMLGCAIIVTNLSKAVFSIAGQLVESGGDLGIGTQMENQANQAKQMVRNQTIGRFGL